MSEYSHQLIEQLKRHEGFRGSPYKDSVGKITVGYGHNLDDVPISKAVAEAMMIEDLQREESRLHALVPVFETIPEGPRKDALINMAFNLGAYGLSKFRRMWASIGSGDWGKAADEAMQSKWATQVGRRAVEITEQLRTGRYADR